jgi:signal transduction histidine kinase
MNPRTASVALNPAGRAWPQNLAQHYLLALLGWIALACVITLVVWSVSPWFIPQTNNPDVEFIGHRFRMLPSATQAGTEWQSVTLPDTWAARGLPPKGMARYESTFMLKRPIAATQQQTWSVRVDRLSFQHRIWVNGQLIHTDLIDPEPLGRPLAYQVQFPAGLLQAGLNQVQIEVQYGSMGGMSQPFVGPTDELGAGHIMQSFLTQTLPLTVNVIGAAFSGFLILIWRRRPSELDMGMLGMLCIVVSVRNCCYYIVHGPSLPGETSAWLYLTAQTTATVLLGGFAMAIAGKHWAWFKKCLWAVQIGFPLLAGIAAQQGMINGVRAAGYPVLLLLMLPTLALLLQLHERFSKLSAVGMVLGIAVSLVAGIHDYLRLQGLISVMHTYWLPLASPITLASYSIVLMNRFVEAGKSTEQHNIELEAKVTERTQALTAANAAKGHFLAAASHDLRQPVAAVGLLSGLLRDRLRGTPLHDMTLRLMDAVRAMETLLNGLLDLSRLEAGAIKPHWQAVDLGAMLARISSHEQESARQRGLSLRVHATDAVAYSDPILLEQMIRNLIGNALRYTQRGGVLVGVRQRGSHLLIQVWDTGQGIAREDQQRIFDDFVQLDNAERNQAKGLGLGLAIVQRAAQLMGSQVKLTSRVGKGSCFTIEVPAAKARAQARRGERAAAADLAPETKPLADRHIILLDDDEVLRHAVGEQLKAWGAHVSKVTSLDELEELLQRVMSVDLLLTDHRLPDGSGLDAINMVRSIHAGLGAVVITGDTGSEPLQALARCSVPVLHKPFPAHGLLKAIEQQLNKPT